MELKLAVVKQAYALGCVAQFLDGSNAIETVYSQAMLNYGIYVQPLDLVAVDLAADPPQTVFRWQRVRVINIHERTVQIDDGASQTRTAHIGAEVTPLPQAGDAAYVGGETLVAAVETMQSPDLAAHFASRHLPAVEEMYRHMAEATPSETVGRAPKQVVKQSYDQIAQAHLDWSRQVRMAERARYTQLVLDQVPKGAEVLDLGCATASLTTPQLARRFRLTGVDISPHQIEMAQQQMPLTTFICADMTQLNFLPESYDAVVAFYSLIHVPRHEQPALLEKIAQWLRPRGLFVGTFTAVSTEGGYEDDWLGAPMFWSGYDSTTNMRLLEEAGLEIVSAQEETADEFGQPTTFLWIVARKPRHDE